jgi:nitroreductase
MVSNDAIEAMLNHRSIRKFTAQSLDQQTIDTLLQVASRSASSMFMQQFSIISVTDSALKTLIKDITGHSSALNNGHLFIFIADQYRNEQIGQKENVDTTLLGQTDRLLAGIYDATIAAQSIVVAAESMQLGTVYLGSLLNDAQQVIDAFKLPRLTFPVFALALGYPDDQPELKPRLPLAAVHFENQYQLPANYEQLLDQYDQQLQSYYEHRSSHSRAETFRHNIIRQMTKSPKKRKDLFNVLQNQGFLTELK